MIRTYAERWQIPSCLLLEGNDKGHDSKLAVHKLVTKKMGGLLGVGRTERNELHWQQSRFGSDSEDKILAMKPLEQTH